MGKKYDATLKYLVDAHPADWLGLAGLPVGPAVAVVEAELSTVMAAADKVLHVGGPAPYLAHIEFQSGPDANLDRRALFYNALLRRRQPLPVRSAALLLQPSARSPQVTGGVRDVADPACRLEFSYRLVNVWEQPPDALLTGGLGTLPLTPVTLGPTASDADLTRVFREVAGRLRAEADAGGAAVLWTATYLMSGLRHDPDATRLMMKGVWDVDWSHSSTYRQIIKEGREEGRGEGRVEAARAAVLRVGRRRLGAPDAASEAALNEVSDAGRLDVLLDRTLTAGSWDELLAPGD